MKKLWFILFIAFAIASCGKASKIKSDAETAMVQLFKEVAKVPESVKVDEIEVKFSDDSLCILNANFTAKNGLGHEPRLSPDGRHIPAEYRRKKHGLWRSSPGTAAAADAANAGWWDPEPPAPPAWRRSCRVIPRQQPWCR